MRVSTLFSSLHPSQYPRGVYFVLVRDVLSFRFHVFLDLRRQYFFFIAMLKKHVG